MQRVKSADSISRAGLRVEEPMPSRGPSRDGRMGDREAGPPSWDLSVLYDSPLDPAIERDLGEALVAAEVFRHSWEGRVQERCVEPAEAARALEAFEACRERILRPLGYAMLLLAADTQGEASRALYGRASGILGAVKKLLIFFPLQLARMGPGTLADLAAHPACRGYGPYLRRIIRQAPAFLPEAAEHLALDRDLTAREAWRLFYDMTLGALRIREPRRGGRPIGLPEALGRLGAADARRRKAAFHGIYQALDPCIPQMAFALDTLTHHEILDTSARGFGSPLDAAALAGGFEAKKISELLDLVEPRYSLATRYFRLKAAAFGSARLAMEDLAAPWGRGACSASFGAARRRLERTAGAVAPAWHEAVSRVFTDGRIDAAPKAGKQGGAFCHAPPPQRLPYVFLSYTGSFRDFLTLAHEIGHAVHYTLAARQSGLVFDGSRVVEEAAATLFELLACRQWAVEGAPAEVGMQLAAACIEGFIATVMRQSVLTRFELALNRRRRVSPLDADFIGGAWMEENSRLYADGIEMPGAYRDGWVLVPHLFHRPLTCWVYVYGQLISAVLYRRYLDEGARFAARLNRLFEAGGSAEPAALLRGVGIDLDGLAFVGEAFEVFEGFLGEFERMVQDSRMGDAAP
ncbi:M3 family metallopeptidase [Desulfatiglans anilini]|uniref:M3 family metallopeptidase n=1 Tax=Desulfatiglans anilini TaxID=90728 RepID=UPI000557EF19|nr:M3 family metallopeptidase [Desulfatiglans anilini]VBB43751.1 putative Oligoendopeptidase, pepF/M3 family [uncultured Desulfatiglans sp.]